MLDDIKITLKSHFCHKFCLIWFFTSVNNLSVIKGWIFLGRTSTKLGLMCLAQGHNAVMLLRLEPPAPLSRVKHSTTEPLRSPNFCGENVIVLSLCMQRCYGRHNASRNL